MARINAYPSSSTINASDTVIGTNSQNLRTENYTLAQIGQVALGYTSYTAILNQSGLAAPVPTVLKNDTGRTFTWIYQNLGEYVIEADSNIFNASTTLVFGNIGLRSKAEYFRWRVTDPIKIEITAFDKDGNPSDDIFENGSFEIRIYS